jgi:uncharacterized MAPEG superfamily protein
MDAMFTCLFIAMLLPFIPRMFVARAQLSQGYNNHEPRRQQMQLTGLGQRAVGAHQNSFEALILFASAVLIAYVTQVESLVCAQLSIAFIICRVLYIALYLTDMPNARSTIWTIGFGLTVTLAAARWIF